MDVIKQLLGRLHPLIVHLPIGFIILGLLLQWYDRKTRSHTKIIGLYDQVPFMDRYSNRCFCVFNVRANQGASENRLS